MRAGPSFSYPPISLLLRQPLSIKKSLCRSDTVTVIVADPDVYPGFWFLSIPGSWIISDSGTKNSNQRRGKNLLTYLFCNHLSQNFKYLILNRWRKNLGQFTKNYKELFTLKFSPSSQKMALGSGIENYSRSRIQGSERYRNMG
jgi:hypothetical protein